MALGALAACGGRSVRAEEGAADEPLPCRFEVAWELELSREREYSLDRMVPGRMGHVLSGRRFVEGRESSVVLAIDEFGSVVWERHLEQRQSVLASWGEDFVVAGTRGVAGRRGEVVVTLFGEDGEPRWEAVTGTEGSDYAAEIVAGEGLVGVVGVTEQATGDEYDAFASVIDPNGRVLFAGAYGETTNQIGRARDELAFGGTFDGDGRLVVAAQRWLDGGGGPLWIFALDAGGAIVRERLDEAESVRSNYQLFAQTRDGGLVIADTLAREDSTGSGRARILRLDERGDVAWTTLLADGAERQSVSELFELEGGGFLAIGHFADPNAPGSRIFELDAAGSFASELPVEDGGVVLDGLGRIRPASSSGFWLAGSEWGVDDEPDVLRVVRVDGRGRVLFRHESPGEGVAGVHSLDVSASGRVVTVGTFYDDVHQSRVSMLEEICPAPNARARE